jgi:aminoglycoside 6'-N-acetyltransferase I
VEIVDLAACGPEVRDAVVALLHDDGGWDHGPRGWPDLAAARVEVEEALGPGRIARVALQGDRTLGFVGGIDQYDGPTWELHPLVVAPGARGRGVGTALVADLEREVHARGGRTVYLGTDDESGTTTLADRDVYADVPGAIAGIATLPGAPRHPFELYRRLGYTVVGVIPDANGPGRPDILMAKRLGGVTS